MKLRLPERNDLQLSLLLLSSVVALALVFLALEGNWPKVLRVASAFAAYALILFPSRGDAEVGLMRFVLAGTAAGLPSGLIRTEALPPMALAVQILAGGFLLAPVHWLALRWQQRVRSGTAA